MSKLVITEKPSVAHTIAAVLGADARMDGYLEGGGYIVSWCVGHLAELANAEEYDPQFAKWRLEDLPILPDNWRYAIPHNKQKRFAILRSLMDREDVTEIVNACDAGREGELIFRNVYILAGCKKPMLRLWISSMEDAAIREGFAHLRDGHDYDGLYQAALCRAKADWLVGINATRLYSVMYHRTLSVGRVMSPTLALLTQREAEIASFTPEPFWTVELACGDMTASGERLTGRPAAEKVATACQGHTAIVRAVERREKSEKAPALYDLTTLQREANRILGYTAQQTLDYLQALYEKKLCTYPRTDSRYLTDDMADVVPGYVAVAAKLCDVAVPESVAAAQVCNSKKVTDHHAIIPTRSAGAADIAALPSGEQKILRLAALGLLRAVSGPYRYEETAATLESGGESFTVKGRIVLDMGWRVFTDDAPENKELPPLTEGQRIAVDGVTVKEGQTTPPKHFTEDTLLSAMETAGAKDAPEDAERKGLGTPATRAATLEKLVASGFLERKHGKKAVALVPTSLGTSLISVLPEQLCSPLLTAEWEHKLKSVERGELQAGSFLVEITDMLDELVQTRRAVPGAERLFPSGRKVVGRCPRCGCDVTESKMGYFCEGVDCRFAMWRDNKYLVNKRAVLTAPLVTELLEKGRAKLTGLYSERTGKIYDAILVMEDDGQQMRYSLEFNRG